MTDEDLKLEAMKLVQRAEMVIPALAPAYLNCAASIFNYLAAKQKEKDVQE